MYVSTKRQDKFASIPEPTTPGELGYLVAQMIAKLRKHDDGSSTHTFNAAVIGELDMVRTEFLARFSDPYEAGRKAGNGDCFVTTGDSW